MESMGSIVLFVIALLVFGALNTLVTKLTFQLKAVDMNGNVEIFQKQWFGIYRMFQGMAFVIVFHFINELRNYSKRNSTARRNCSPDCSGPEDLNTNEAVPPVTPLKAYFLVALPATLDLIGTVLMYIGLFYNSPSVWQMFRGAMIIFATIFSVVFLKKKMSKLKWMGIGMCVFAIVLVGTSNMLSEKEQVEQVDPKLRVYGMGMILCGMFVQAGQIVAEEQFMKGIAIPPMCIVGMEGVWGCIITFFIVFPIVQAVPGDDIGGCQENLENDVYMVNHSPTLQKVVLVYLVSVFTYNVSAMMVTYALSAVHRTMLEASRTAVIWGVDLVIHQLFPDSGYGESWNRWSLLQLLGFALLVLGQATYSELISWGLGASWRSPPSLAEPLISPAREPGEFFSSPKSPFVSPPSNMHSPTGMMNLPVDLPEETSVALVGLDDKVEA